MGHKDNTSHLYNTTPFTKHFQRWVLSLHFDDWEIEAQTRETTLPGSQSCCTGHLSDSGRKGPPSFHLCRQKWELGLDGDNEQETRSRPRTAPTRDFILMLLPCPEHRSAMSSVVRTRPNAYKSKSVNNVNVRPGETWGLGRWGVERVGFAFFHFSLEMWGCFSEFLPLVLAQLIQPRRSLYV